VVNDQAVPNGYGGLNWENVRVVDADSYVPSGYQAGTISHPFVALNENPSLVADVATISSPTLLDFNSVYLTGAWNDGLVILVEGFQGANTTPIYSHSVTTSYYAPTFFNADYVGVTRVAFTAANPGTVVQLGGTYFAMDDLTINGVAEPETWLLLGTGPLGLSAALRRRKRAS
jgi:hypothetical protein